MWKESVLGQSGWAFWVTLHVSLFTWREIGCPRKKNGQEDFPLSLNPLRSLYGFATTLNIAECHSKCKEIMKRASATVFGLLLLLKHTVKIYIFLKINLNKKE